MEQGPFDILRIAALAAAGCVAGMMNAVAGGGTLVTFPTLVLTGIPSIPANATSIIALLPAALGSAAGYWKKIRGVARWLSYFAPVSLAGGLLGGVLLVRTPTQVFDALVPFLILLATILFMLQATVTRLLGVQSNRAASRRWIAGGVVFQFLVAIYGGYFGAGIGILMLASLGLMGFEDVHAMNTLKVILGFLINVVAALYFIVAGVALYLGYNLGPVIQSGPGGHGFAIDVVFDPVSPGDTGVAVGAMRLPSTSGWT